MYLNHKVFKMSDIRKHNRREVNINIDYLPYIIRLNYNLVKKYGQTQQSIIRKYSSGNKKNSSFN